MSALLEVSINLTYQKIPVSLEYADVACGAAVTAALGGANLASRFWNECKHNPRGKSKFVSVLEISRIASDPKRYLELSSHHPLTSKKITNLRLLALVLTRASTRPMDQILRPISIYIEEFTLLERDQLGSGDPLDLSAFINPVRSTAAPDSVLSMKTRAFQKENIEALAIFPIEAMDVSDEMMAASDKLVLAYLVTPMKTAQNESLQIVPFAYLYSGKQLGIKWFADSAMRSKETSYILCLLDIEQQYFGPAYHEEFVAIFAKHPELIFELHDKESGLSQQYITMETFRNLVMENIRFLFQERARHFTNSMLAKLACPRQYVQNFPLYHPDDRVFATEFETSLDKQQTCKKIYVVLQELEVGIMDSNMYVEYLTGEEGPGGLILDGPRKNQEDDPDYLESCKNCLQRKLFDRMPELAAQFTGAIIYNAHISENTQVHDIECFGKIFPSVVRSIFGHSTRCTESELVHVCNMAKAYAKARRLPTLESVLEIEADMLLRGILDKINLEEAEEAYKKRVVLHNIRMRQLSFDMADDHWKPKDWRKLPADQIAAMRDRWNHLLVRPDLYASPSMDAADDDLYVTHDVSRVPAGGGAPVLSKRMQGLKNMMRAEDCDMNIAAYYCAGMGDYRTNGCLELLKEGEALMKAGLW